MVVAVIVPTYNEIENIARLIFELTAEFKKSKHTFHIVVVDGNSIDGTKELVTKLSSENQNIHLLIEKSKTGLGSAYIWGMEYAMKELNAEGLVEMDADFQHDPKELLSLVTKFEDGADYVIGSRYIKGGSIPKEWELYRKFLSFAGNLFSRVVLGLLSVHDVTSGYRISRASIIKKIDLSKLERKGYMYKIQLLYLIDRLGGKIAEVPIKFGLRDRGGSKMGIENLIGSLRIVVELRVKEKKHFVKFLIAGATGLFVQTSIFYSLVLSHLTDPRHALLPAFLSAVATTFTINNLWSFKDRKINNNSEKVTKFIVFALVNIGSYFIQKACIILSQLAFDRSVFYVLVVGYPLGILCGLVWNYFFYSRVVWKKAKG